MSGFGKTDKDGVVVEQGVAAGLEGRDHVPFPEVIDGNPWTIMPSPAGTLRGGANREARRMIVPLEGTERAEWVRAHEMAHVKWSPAGRPPSSRRRASPPC